MSIIDRVTENCTRIASDELEPGSEKWVKSITASKIPAILGCDAFGGTRYQMWHQIAGNWESDFKGNSATRRGSHLEKGIAEWWLEEHPDHSMEWAGTFQSSEYDWAYATPDYIVEEPDGTLAILEIKTSARMDGFGPNGSSRIPDHYWLQIAWQCIVTGIRKVHVAVLGTFLERRDYPFEMNDFMLESVLEDIIAFHDSLPGQVNEMEPFSEDVELDWKTILAVTQIERRTADVSAAFDDYRSAKLEERDAKKRAEAAKAIIQASAADADEAVAGDVVVAKRDASGKKFRFMQVK